MSFAVSREALEAARALHARVPVVELHADYPVDVYRRRRAGEQAPYADDYAHRLRKGGVDVQLLAAGGDVPDQHECAGDEHRSALAMFQDLLDEEGATGIVVVRTRADLERALGGEGVGLVLHLEGARPFVAAEDPTGSDFHDVVRTLHGLGLRSVQLTWNGPNPFADGVLVDRPHGLTPLGRDLVAALDELGILLDVSHLAEPCFWDLLELTRAPVIASHANASAVRPHRRNLTDAQISALAETGGLVGVVFIADFIGPEPTIAALVDHVDHMVRLAGIEAIGVGADYVEFAMDLMTDPGEEESYLGPEGLRAVETLPVFTAALLDRGYSEDDAARVIGGNAVRVLRERLPDAP